MVRACHSLLAPLTFTAMKEAMILVLHLMNAIARLLGPGGTKAIVAENLLLRHQLLVHGRTRKRAPNLTTQDRVLLGFWVLV